MRTEVYSWRLSKDLKTEVERAARVRKESVSSILETAVRDWLEKSVEAEEDEDQQRRLHAQAESCLGSISGARRERSENVRAAVRARLSRRNGR